MAHATPQGPQLLHGWRKLNRFDRRLGAQLPEAYKKFWREWKHTTPTAVHYVPKTEPFECDEVSGGVKPVQNIPLPLIDTPESHEGIWGGEAIIKGFQKRQRLKRRVPHFWFPTLRRSVVHSRVLNEYYSVVVTDRTIDQIHDCHGFDHYLLKNLACDLRSLLALKFKRKILLNLLHGCPNWEKNPTEQTRILKEYKCYLDSYTPEEIDWYGHTYAEALRKLMLQIRAENPVVPHKVEFRSKLIEQLKNAGIREAGGNHISDEKTAAKDDNNENADIERLTKLEAPSSTSSWLSKINPFGKKQET
ncbi:large ribosomal subunit protein bL28m [Eurosta solidaginis]|uniref:large ribosomal subunit protein bL28m n=1 Tax=Eurosta solidaginis TaxID=178769 RepID=UPI003530A12D